MISWLEKGQLPEKAETRGKTREVLVARSIFNPAVFKMIDGVLMFTKAANRNQTGEVGRICIPASTVKKVWSLCHQSYLGEHRGLEGMLNKFLRGFFMLSARRKLRFLNEGCDICIVKERSMPIRTGVHMPSLTGYVGEKLYIVLVSLCEEIDTYSRRRMVLADTVALIRSQTRKRAPWLTC